MPAGIDERTVGFPARELAADEKILMADHVVDAKGRPTRAVIEHAIFDLQPGVTVLTVSPATDAPEIRGLDPEWSTRVEDYLVTSHDSGIRNLVERSGAILIGYRELRSLQRAGGGCRG